MWVATGHVITKVMKQDQTNIPCNTVELLHQFKKMETITRHSKTGNVWKKTSYHISSIGDEGEEVIEESAICEDGYQIYHSTKYKKRMKRLEKLRQKNVEDLESMKRKIATRFLLTKAKPSMSEEAVERYILENFDVDEVYVRKKPNEI